MTALGRFEDIGIEFDKPELSQVSLPYDITLLSSEQLAERFTALTAWADYIASQLAGAQVKERTAINDLSFINNSLLVTRMGASARGERITLVKAQIAIDPEVLAASQAYEDVYAYRKMVEMYLNNHERDLNLVSREITRRGSDQRAMRKDWNGA